METERKAQSFSFRAWPGNAELLEFAGRAGINISELINETLAASLRRQLETKARKAREALAAPLP